MAPPMVMSMPRATKFRPDFASKATFIPRRASTMLTLEARIAGRIPVIMLRTTPTTTESMTISWEITGLTLSSPVPNSPARYMATPCPKAKPPMKPRTPPMIPWNRFSMIMDWKIPFRFSPTALRTPVWNSRSSTLMSWTLVISKTPVSIIRKPSAVRIVLSSGIMNPARSKNCSRAEVTW